MSIDLDPSWTLQSELGRNNFMDRRGAEELKARIEEYWRQRGFDVQLIVVEAGFSATIRMGRFDLRSDMINGLPRYAVKNERRRAPEPLSP